MKFRNEREKWTKIQEIYESALKAMDRGDPASTLEFLDIILAIETEEPDVLNLAGVASFYCADYEQAERYFEKAVALSPVMYSAWHNLGMIFQVKGDFEKAVEYITKAVEIRPLYAKAWRSLGDCYREMGYSELSREAYETAVEVDDKDIISMYNLAQILVADGEDGKAADLLKTAVADPLIRESARRESTLSPLLEIDGLNNPAVAK